MASRSETADLQQQHQQHFAHYHQGPHPLEPSTSTGFQHTPSHPHLQSSFYHYAIQPATDPSAMNPSTAAAASASTSAPDHSEQDPPYRSTSPSDQYYYGKMNPKYISSLVVENSVDYYREFSEGVWTLSRTFQDSLNFIESVSFLEVGFLGSFLWMPQD